MSEPLRVLLVEDNPGDAELIRAALTGANPTGFDIHHVVRLRDAIAYLQDQSADLVLLDLGLPDSSGIETVRRFRSAMARVPIVVITGNDDEKTGIEAVQEGAQDYLVKGRTPGYHLSRVLRQAVERQRFLDRLSNSELLLKTILDAVPNPIVLQSQDLRIIWSNLAACAPCGLPREQVLGRFCYDAWYHESAVCADCPVLEALRTGSPQESIANREGRTWRVIGAPVRDDRGVVTGCVEISEDITEDVAREESLRHVQKMEALGTLAGGIAHDFNNILSVILGYTELAREETVLNPALSADLAEVTEAAMRAKNLVGQILAFSRPTRTEMGPAQVHLIVKEAVRMLRATLPTTIEIRLDISTFAVARVDPTQIHQVILNLCTNAWHAMRDTGGLLGIELADVTLPEGGCPAEPALSPGPYLRLRVSDTGIGMDEATRLRVFEPYFTTKAKGGGTGLGLAISYGIVKVHRGAIWVESVPGMGSVFTVLLPGLPSHLLPELTKDAMPVPRGHEHVLLVDDEPVLLGVTRRMLESLGYAATSCADAPEALELFRADPGHFDIVITDMTMPTLAGDRLAKGLMAIRPDIPVIICTGFSDRVDAETAMAAGIRAYIMKPTSLRTLAVTIRDVLSRRDEAPLPWSTGREDSQQQE